MHHINPSVRRNSTKPILAGLLIIILSGCRASLNPDSAVDLSLVRDPVHTYYLSPSGSDEASGTSPDSAWATITHALEMSSECTLIIILEGSYVEDPIEVDSSAESIRLTADGEVVIHTNLHISSVNEFSAYGIHWFAEEGRILDAVGPGFIHIQDCIFGDPESPLDLDTGWAIRTHDRCVDLIGNQFYLNSGNVIGVHAYYNDVPECRVFGNKIFNFEPAESRYSIYIGWETPLTVHISEAIIENNSIHCPIGTETYEHVLFVGYTLNPIVRNNVAIGGGYGIGIKGNQHAEVFGNLASFSTLQCIVDKAGNGCFFHDNIMKNSEGALARVTDDLFAELPVQDSIWLSNDFWILGSTIAFIISSPVDILAQEVFSDQNTFHCSSDIWFNNCGHYLTLEEMSESYGWDLNSQVLPLEMNLKDGPDMADEAPLDL